MTLAPHLLLLSAILSCGVQASEQEELARLRSRLNALQQDFAKTNESKSAAADALRESERAISNSNRKLHELAQQQGDANKSLLQLKQQSLQLEKAMQNEQTLLSKLLYQQYLGGKQEYLKLLLNNHDPNQVARELQYYDYIARNRAEWLRSLRQDYAQLAELTKQSQDKAAEIAALQEEERNQRKNLDQEKASRQKTLTKIAQQLKSQRQEIGRLQQDEGRLTKLVDRLAKMLSEPKRKKPSNGERLPQARSDSTTFSELKGRLALPIKGVIAHRFGEKRADSSMLWKGLFLRAPTSQPVKCIAAGQVVFADWMRGFGNLLIVDHGNGYMSLYGYNETLFKQVGDTLKGGDTIAAVGNSGGNEESGLYFELRHEGNPLDPLKWMNR